MVLVVDAGALIALARIGHLDLLRRLAGAAVAPEAVYEEVVGSGMSRPGSAEVRQASWIVRRAVQDRAAVERLKGQVGRGEAEAIVLAAELGADVVVLDDATARRLAAMEGRIVVGLLGLLVDGKRRRLIRALKPLLDELRSAGFFVDDPLYRAILSQAGEVPDP